MPRFVTRVLLVACALIVIGMVGCSGSTPVVVTQIVTVQVEGQPPQMVITETPSPVSLPDRDPIICQQDTFDTMLAALLGGACDFAEMGSLSLDQILFVHELADQSQIAYQAVAAPEWEQVTLNVAPSLDAPNGGLAFFADARVRQAVAFGTNRERMIEVLYGQDGQTMYSFLPQDHPAYLPEASVLYSYDPERARALLSSAGWQDLDGDGYVEAFNDLQGDLGCKRGKWMIPAGTLFEVTYLVPTDSTIEMAAAELFSEDMAAIGLKVNIVESDITSPLTELGPIAQGQYQLAGTRMASVEAQQAADLFGGQNIYETSDGSLKTATTLLAENPATLYNIPLLETDFIQELSPPELLPQGYSLVWLSSIPSPSNKFKGQDIARWCDAEATLSAYTAVHALDQDQAVASLQALQSRFLSEMPLIPLFQHIDYDVHSPNLCGTGRGPRQVATWNVAEWYFAETCP